MGTQEGGKYIWLSKNNQHQIFRSISRTVSLNLTLRRVSKVEIYKTSDVKSETDNAISYFDHNAKPIYQYERTVRASEWINYYYDVVDDDQWFVHFQCGFIHHMGHDQCVSSSTTECRLDHRICFIECARIRDLSGIPANNRNATTKDLAGG
jgi:hypothetical protein